MSQVQLPSRAGHFRRQTKYVSDPRCHGLVRLQEVLSKSQQLAMSVNGIALSGP